MILTEMPLVSICIPTYNRKHTIEKTIHSALGQTYSNIEVIVSDNASTDGTEELINAIKGRRLHYQRHPTNTGAVYNGISAINASTGKYVLLLSSDDYIEPRLIERAVAVLEKHPPIGVYYADYRVVRSDGKEIKYYRINKGVPGECFDVETILRSNAIGLLTAVFRREAYVECGPWVDHPCSDWILWVRMLLAGWGIWGDREVLGTYALSPDADSFSMCKPGVVEQLDQYILAEVDSRNLPESTRRAARRGVAGRYYSVGRRARKRGDYALALRMFKRAIEIYPAMRWRALRQLMFVRTYLDMLRPRFNRRDPT